MEPTFLCVLDAALCFHTWVAASLSSRRKVGQRIHVCEGLRAFLYCEHLTLPRKMELKTSSLVFTVVCCPFALYFSETAETGKPYHFADSLIPRDIQYYVLTWEILIPLHSALPKCVFIFKKFMKIFDSQMFYKACPSSQ